MRSISEVVLRCYNRTQTSFAQPTVFCYFLYLTLGISRTFLYLLSSNLAEKSHHISCAGNLFWKKLATSNIKGNERKKCSRLDVIS